MADQYEEAEERLSESDRKSIENAAKKLGITVRQLMVRFYSGFSHACTYNRFITGESEGDEK